MLPLKGLTGGAFEGFDRFCLFCSCFEGFLIRSVVFLVLLFEGLTRMLGGVEDFEYRFVGFSDLSRLVIHWSRCWINVCSKQISSTGVFLNWVIEVFLWFGVSYIDLATPSHLLPGVKTCPGANQRSSFA